MIAENTKILDYLERIMKGCRALKPDDGFKNLIRFRKFYKLYNQTQNSEISQSLVNINIDEKFKQFNDEFNNLKIEIEQDTK